jgi:hypothetical protein
MLFASTFGSGVGVAEGFGAVALIATPLFHTSFDPDLIQVNFLPPVVDVAPTFLHLAPALTAAKEGVVTREMQSSKTRNSLNRFMAKRYQFAISN